MIKTYATTYQYYDAKARRLAVFCRHLDDDTAEIVTIACSIFDQFNKKFAVTQYESLLEGKTLLTHPKIETIPIIQGQRTLKTLINHCNEKYYLLVGVPEEIIKISLVTQQEYELIVNCTNN